LLNWLHKIGIEKGIGRATHT